MAIAKKQTPTVDVTSFLLTNKLNTKPQTRLKDLQRLGV